MFKTLQKTIRKNLVALARQAAARPWLRARAKRLLDRHPRFKYRLRGLIIAHDLQSRKRADSANNANKTTACASQPATCADLSQVHMQGHDEAKKSPLEQYADSF